MWQLYLVPPRVQFRSLKRHWLESQGYKSLKVIVAGAIFGLQAAHFSIESKIAEAASDVIVDHSGGLHEGVADGGAYEGEAVVA